MKKLVVDIRGKGDFCEIGSAVASVSGNCEIFIKEGTYREKIFIDKPNIRLTGEDREKVQLVFGDYAMMERENGYPIGTFETATLRVGESGEGFSMENMTVVNDAGEGNVVGQAVALYLDCDKAYIHNCRLSARQDTLLCAPIPSDIKGKPMPLNRQYFKDCFIEGNVDFIFGGACALFENCEIFIVGRSGFPSGYVTAACTDKEQEYGFVFKKCSISGSGARERAFLGRPWRDYAKTVFIDCKWDDIIHPEVFSKWNNRLSHLTCFYGFDGMEDFKDSKAEWVHYIDDSGKYSAENMFGETLSKGSP
ncbi:MAG: pectinesterase family protein [Clostridiales bacterium]|nr:pectinesterase family protein [Clostridiales bacterium]